VASVANLSEVKQALPWSPGAAAAGTGRSEDAIGALVELEQVMAGRALVLTGLILLPRGLRRGLTAQRLGRTVSGHLPWF
jgi:hypothetical protein